MEIFFNHIKESEIIGIGPLYMQASKDNVSRSLYNSFRFMFEVHCKTRSIEIHSDYFRPGFKENPDQKETDAYKKWEKQYHDYRDKVVELLETE